MRGRVGAHSAGTSYANVSNIFKHLAIKGLALKSRHAFTPTLC